MTKTQLVPANTRETVSNLFQLPDEIQLGELYKSEDFQTLLSEFNESVEGLILDPIDNFTDHFVDHPPIKDIRSLWINYVDQRDRLKDKKYREEIIKTARSFKPKWAGFPQGNRPIESPEKDYLQDYQKRASALMLRGQFNYPCSIVWTSLDELSKDFISQFKQRDNIRAYDKFKAELSERDPKRWAQQHCFTRLGVSVYPFAEPPLLTALNDVTNSMFNPVLNSNEKNLSFEERKFSNFVRAVTIYRRVWPELSKKEISGSYIRGLVAIISMLDKNILKGSDEWVFEILQEAKDPRYDLIRDNDNLTKVGFVSPNTYTNRHGYDGNRRHQDAVQGFARIWNEIRKDKSNRKDRRIPKIAQYSIDALDNAKFQNMDKVEE